MKNARHVSVELASLRLVQLLFAALPYSWKVPIYLVSFRASLCFLLHVTIDVVAEAAAWQAAMARGNVVEGFWSSVRGVGWYW